MLIKKYVRKYKVLYTRNCDYCGQLYKGMSEHFCSISCRNKGVVKPAHERFWEKVKIDDETGCWNWQAKMDHDGYGHFKTGGKDVYAHRAGWEMVFGKIPEDKILHHTCRNRRCVNYYHLKLSTHKENAEEKCKAGMQPDMRGMAQAQAKLTDDKVREIRLLLKTDRTIMSIAREFEVSGTTISHIKYNRNWTHVK